MGPKKKKRPFRIIWSSSNHKIMISPSYRPSLKNSKTKMSRITAAAATAINGQIVTANMWCKIKNQIHRVSRNGSLNTCRIQTSNSMSKQKKGQPKRAPMCSTTRNSKSYTSLSITSDPSSEWLNCSVSATTLKRFKLMSRWCTSMPNRKVNSKNAHWDSQINIWLIRPNKNLFQSKKSLISIRTSCIISIKRAMYNCLRNRSLRNIMGLTNMHIKCSIKTLQK